MEAAGSTVNFPSAGPGPLAFWGSSCDDCDMFDATWHWGGKFCDAATNTWYSAASTTRGSSTSWYVDDECNVPSDASVRVLAAKTRTRTRTRLNRKGESKGGRRRRRVSGLHRALRRRGRRRARRDRLRGVLVHARQGRCRGAPDDKGHRPRSHARILRRRRPSRFGAADHASRLKRPSMLKPVTGRKVLLAAPHPGPVLRGCLRAAAPPPAPHHSSFLRRRRRAPRFPGVGRWPSTLKQI